MNLERGPRTSVAAAATLAAAIAGANCADQTVVTGPYYNPDANVIDAGDVNYNDAYHYPDTDRRPPHVDAYPGRDECVDTVRGEAYSRITNAATTIEVAAEDRSNTEVNDRYNGNWATFGVDFSHCEVVGDTLVYSMFDDAGRYSRYCFDADANGGMGTHAAYLVNFELAFDKSNTGSAFAIPGYNPSQTSQEKGRDPVGVNHNNLQYLEVTEGRVTWTADLGALDGRDMRQHVVRYGTADGGYCAVDGIGDYCVDGECGDLVSDANRAVRELRERTAY